MITQLARSIYKLIRKTDDSRLAYVGFGQSPIYPFTEHGVLMLAHVLKTEL